jgi:hypothetical protein
MKRSILGLALILTAVLAGSILVPWAAGEKPDRIRAAHPVHAAAGIACETCHPAGTSQAGTDNLLPEMDTCAECHDIADETTCSQCHANPQAAAAAPRVTTMVQKFSHAKHLGQGTDCAACHGAAAKSEPQLPEKALCRRCHETASGRADCALCHAENEALRPATHTDQWLALHATEARVDESRCLVCHTQTDCQECHAGDNVRPRVHPLNFAYDHALAARSGEATCSACHEDAQFCQGCHLANYVMPENHSRADWVAGPLGGRHAEEAGFDLESCVACHDGGQASPVCARCHGR